MGGAVRPQEGKLQPGTKEHTEWVVDRVAAYLRDGADVSRNAFVAAQRETPEPYVTRRDLEAAGGWRPVLRAARGGALPVVQLPDKHRLKGVSSLVDRHGNTVLQWVKTADNRPKETPAERVRRLMRELPSVLSPREGLIERHPGASMHELLAAYVFGDHHLGLLRAVLNYGLEEGSRLFIGAMRELVFRGPRTKIALLVNVGDFFHSDIPENVTKRHRHKLEVDGTYLDIRRKARDLWIEAIDLCLEHHDEVHVYHVPGNHDDESTIMLALLLELYYRNEPRVFVHVPDDIYAYHRFGAVLLGITHGYETKLSKLPMVMANDRPEDWGATRFRHWLLGHTHHKDAWEEGGVKMEVFNTLAVNDDHAHKRGFRSGRDATRIVYHIRNGEVSRETVSAAMLEKA